MLRYVLQVCQYALLALRLLCALLVTLLPKLMLQLLDELMLLDHLLLLHRHEHRK